MRRMVLVVAIALTAIVSSLTTLAVASYTTKRGVYVQVDGHRGFPAHLVIRCPFQTYLAEDSFPLHLVSYADRDHVVVRCTVP